MKSLNLPFVLVAEDDENDVFFLRRAFERARLSCPLIDVPNGEEAINYLSRCLTCAQGQVHPLPALLLLDLKMPLLNGFDVLAWLQQRREFNGMPAIVLSSSGLEADVKRARELGARDYRVKPHSGDELLKLVQEFSLHWIPQGLPDCSARAAELNPA